LYKDEIILKAAVELNPEYIYEFKRGTLGPTLYVRAKDKEQARIIRKEIPPTFEGYRVLVTYHAPRDEFDDLI
jgi:hypothetical protein